MCCTANRVPSTSEVTSVSIALLLTSKTSVAACATVHSFSALLQVVTVNVADPPIDMPDSYFPLKPSLHKVNTKAEVHLPRRQYTFPLLTLLFSRPATIGELSDEVLLIIFRYSLDASPLFWPRLVHICRRWRRLVFASQRALLPRLFRTHRTSVPKTLENWLAIPQSHSAPLQGVVVLNKHSHRLSDHFMGVEYEQPFIDQLGGIGTSFV